jgi:hypothetical protein
MTISKHIDSVKHFLPVYSGQMTIMDSVVLKILAYLRQLLYHFLVLGILDIGPPELFAQAVFEQQSS